MRVYNCSFIINALLHLFYFVVMTKIIWLTFQCRHMNVCWKKYTKTNKQIKRLTSNLFVSSRLSCLINQLKQISVDFPYQSIILHVYLINNRLICQNLETLPSNSLFQVYLNNVIQAMLRSASFFLQLFMERTKVVLIIK